MRENIVYMLLHLKQKSAHARYDWLSRLFEMMPVRGRVDLRCLYGAPWRIEQSRVQLRSAKSLIALLSADRRCWMIPAGGRPLELKAGDILLLPGNPRHGLHDGSGAPPLAKSLRPQSDI
jgi:AraC family transcriptional regulator, activator of mtrCDE